MYKEYQYIMSNIRQYRILRQMTQEEFAEAAGLSLSNIAQLESNRKSIGLESLGKIADCLKEEKQIMYEMVRQLKKSIRENIHI
ncbi:MAG: helix-turn-helix transcriptional regulator [Lachnospiraceae bacterium]|nr:helix-turn-helix transcriptional regulator [Lachnospiraceae bacterium]